MLSTLGTVGFVLYYFAWFKSFGKLIKNSIKTKCDLNVLLIVIIGLLLIMDYANVSYYDIFHILFISISYTYLNEKSKKITAKGDFE